MKIGIDQIGLFTPGQYVDLVEVAQARGVDPNKFTIGIGQDRQSVPGLTQDAVTMAANAALDFLTAEERDQVELIILGTESGVDNSKAGALYVQHLLGLNQWSRAFEIKEACYGATAGLQMAADFVAAHPDKKALVFGSDIARYGLATGGEVTQGAGAVAMLISANPRILALNNDSVYRSQSIQDFWRPVYSDIAFARGHYSTNQYIDFFQKVWAKYREETGHTLDDFKALCFHLPYTKQGLKALRKILPETNVDHQQSLLHYYDESIQYTRQIGNIYTGSLYLGLLSLLETSTSLAAGDTIGLFSYGSGAEGEFYSAELQPGFEEQLHGETHQQMLANRRQLSVPEYEKVFSEELPTDGSAYKADTSNEKARFYLAGIKNHERQYRDHLRGNEDAGAESAPDEPIA
ncbi:hydroxymethylglutaryl-CoA synthase [Lactobacillus selangorensis]|uniref:Hydroxymethylglutaryl-CoA synthase n=1 Tax=Lactobacillus selangorensis TaxID=81857 RepID=A0A0R2G3G5_9LACO|nr:hydroxymethylglutaryl-CoA synthase [Lactobacillus selangorensis]KRN28383.1 hydroxymethylglutaryl-CoA synthase [Lactobacillus selangorensis]KRN31884.1 hydroxymethylglutaryl-CoA synthase [Lactobacillus selangorensis]